jgi:hypothetical protein
LSVEIASICLREKNEKASKTTQLTERVGLELRWDVFNAFNFANFANPNSVEVKSNLEH